MGLPQPSLPMAVSGNSLDNLYQAERGLLDGYAVIPLFHLPVATAASTRVHNWSSDPLGGWNVPGFSASDGQANRGTDFLANVWLTDSLRGAAR
jgi:hypothetical protein